MGCLCGFVVHVIPLCQLPIADLENFNWQLKIGNQ